MWKGEINFIFMGICMIFLFLREKENMYNKNFQKYIILENNF